MVGSTGSLGSAEGNKGWGGGRKSGGRAGKRNRDVGRNLGGGQVAFLALGGSSWHSGRHGRQWGGTAVYGRMAAPVRSYTRLGAAEAGCTSRTRPSAVEGRMRRFEMADGLCLGPPIPTDHERF